MGNTETSTLRLLSFNIQAGANTGRLREYVTRSWQHVLPFKKRKHLNLLASHISNYDLVGLQEADTGSLRSGFVNQAEYLADLAGFPYWSQQRNRKVGPIASSSNSLLSRVEPNEVLDYQLPGRLKGRGALVAIFGKGHEKLAVIIAHLSLGASARSEQFEFLRDLVWPFRHVVLMGDLNCSGEHPRFLRFLLQTGLRTSAHPQPPTFPSWRPQRAIDHVLLSPSLTCRRCFALPVQLSDHLPLAVELELPPELRLEAS
jgi:endonuclease/exonuclease/phosphatase family metal-dependent hydrolase